MNAVAFLLAGSALQAGGTLLQKQRVASRRPDVDWVDGLRGPGRFLSALVRDPLWVGSYLLVVPGAFLGLQALSMMDLTMLKSLARMEVVFAVLGGAWLLGERMSRRERIGVMVTLVGGVLLAPAAGVASGRSPSLPVHLGYMAACFGGLALLLGVSRAAPRRLSAEIALGLGAGLILGAGDVLVKGATEVVRSRIDAFSIASLETHAVLWTTPELWGCITCLLTGLFLYQLAFSSGRVAVLVPVAAITATLPPMLFGVLARGEALGAERLPGIVVVVLGTALLSWPRVPDPPAVLAPARSG